MAEIICKGCIIAAEGNKITITIPDATITHGRSSTGKTEIIASTEGNKELTINEKKVWVGVNVYTK
jgi:hypothetical protein